MGRSEPDNGWSLNGALRKEYQKTRREAGFSERIRRKPNLANKCMKNNHPLKGIKGPGKRRKTQLENKKSKRKKTGTKST